MRLSPASSPGSGTRAAVIVAHPDDEVLWCGGLMLSHTDWRWTIISMSRAKDPDRAPRFYRALRRFGAVGNMADLDDSPEQRPLSGSAVEATVLKTLPGVHYDVLITHSPQGEYTRHRRHEEVGRAVSALWRMGRLQADALWTFAYDDGAGLTLPQAREDADLVLDLPEELWRLKREVVTGTYGFAEDSFEARATPRTEAFLCRELRSLKAAEAAETGAGERRQ